MDYTDIRNGLVAAIAVNVEEPTVNKYVGDFIKQEVDNFPAQECGRSRSDTTKESKNLRKSVKAIAGVTKLAP